MRVHIKAGWHSRKKDKKEERTTYKGRPQRAHIKTKPKPKINRHKGKKTYKIYEAYAQCMLDYKMVIITPVKSY